MTDEQDTTGVTAAGTRVFRAMSPDGEGRPNVGRSARKLGVRVEGPNVDMEVDADGTVGPDSGGMSVAPESPMLLKAFRRPVSLGGTGQDPAWSIAPDELPEGLGYRRDADDHGMIVPSRRMPLKEFEGLLSSLREDWEEYDEQ